MLPKKKRVTKELFQEIIKQGGTLSTSLFTFRYIKQKAPQYAFIVPKSVAKQALKRNLLRRKGYSVLRQNTPKSGAGLFFYKKHTKKITIDDIKTNIDIILSKI